MEGLRPRALPKGTSYELEPLIKYLRRKNEGEYKAALGSLITLQQAWSSIYDLLKASEIMNFLRDGTPDSPRWAQIPSSITTAGFSQAILLYVRATNMDKDRKGLNVKGWLSTEEWETHLELKRIRNKVIAHLDKERKFSGKSFHDERLVIRHDGMGGQSVLLAHMRLGYDPKLSDSIVNLIVKVIDNSNDYLKDRIEKFGKIISKLSQFDPMIGRTIELKPFDALRFFGDPNAASDFINGEYVGSNFDKELLLYEDRPDD